MQKYFFNIIAKTSIVALLVSCNSIFEKNIDGENLTVIIPKNGDTLSTNTVHFKWEALDGASSYRLQVVQPSFDNINLFVLDSNVVDEEFFLVLAPGKYQFKIRGENSAHQTTYTEEATFVMDSTSSLTGSKVPLSAPVEGGYTNSTTLNFSWVPILNADSYDLEIRSGQDFNSGSPLYVSRNIKGNNHDSDESQFKLVDGKYAWGVRAINESNLTFTEYNTRTFFVDQTVPVLPSLSSPANDEDFNNDTVVFKWTFNDDPGDVKSPVSAIIEVSENENFSSFEVKKMVDTGIDTFFHVFNGDGNFWWRLKTVDLVENESTGYTTPRKVILN